MEGCLKQLVSAVQMEGDVVAVLMFVVEAYLVDLYDYYSIDVLHLELLIYSFDQYFFVFRSIENVVVLILVHHHYHLNLNCV